MITVIIKEQWIALEQTFNAFKIKGSIILMLVLCAGIRGVTQNTGLLSPGVTISSSSVINPDNAFSSNNVYAVFDANNDNAVYGNFGIAIPGGATIVGIEVLLEGNRGNNRDLAISLTWNSGTSFTTETTMTAFETNDATRTVGSASNLWGRSWTATELANGNFGVRCRVPAAANGNLNLDHVQVRVTYTITSPLTINTAGATTFTVPAGVTCIQVEAWGGGGGGAAGSTAAGGGGGGAYTRGTLSGLTPGGSLVVTVGDGGNVGLNGGSSSVGSSITANGGSAGSGRAGGNGGSAAAVSGNVSVSYAGGNGGNAREGTTGPNNEAGGGGGGSAYTTVGGNAGSNGSTNNNTQTAGGGGTGGGGGGAATDGTPAASEGNSPGGGGGGRGEGTSTSQAGAPGQVVITWGAAIAPAANFSANATSVVQGTAVTFTNMSANAASYSWSFPGGSPSSSTAANPVVTYNTPGTHSVTLVVTNACGTDTEIKNNYIEVVTTVTYNGSGTFTPPAGVTCIKVEAWGGGGAGGGATRSTGTVNGGGGAGGAYASSVITVTPGNSYTVTVGGQKTATATSTNTQNTGNPSWFNNTSTIYAQGGPGGSPGNNNSGIGGTGSDALSIGQTIIAGANGANGTTGVTGSAGGAGANGGGTGASGVMGNNDGTTGTAPGGGGSGGRRQSGGGTTNSTGGSGAAGRVIISWGDDVSCCLAPSIPTISVTETSGSANNDGTICSGASVTLAIASGNLNNAANWQWYSGSCGGTPVGSGTSVTVTPGATPPIMYVARGAV